MNSRIDPWQALAGLFGAVYRPGIVAPEVRDWFLRGLTDWLQAGQEPPLDACLGLRPGPGQRRQCTVKRIEDRNFHLRRAAALVAVADVSTWERAQRLGKAIARLRRCRHPDADPLMSALTAAERHYRLPATAERLYQILK